MGRSGHARVNKAGCAGPPRVAVYT